MNTLSYHTHVYYSEPSSEYPGQSNLCQPTFGLFGFSRFSGLIGSMNEINEIDQTNQTDQIDQPDRPQPFSYISVLGQITQNPELITQNFPKLAG